MADLIEALERKHRESSETDADRKEEVTDELAEEFKELESGDLPEDLPDDQQEALEALRTKLGIEADQASSIEEGKGQK